MPAYRSRIERLEALARAAIPKADSGAAERLMARFENIRARMTPDRRALALAHPEQVSQAEALVARWEP